MCYDLFPYVPLGQALSWTVRAGNSNRQKQVATGGSHSIGHSRRRLSNVLKDIFDALRVLCDYSQQHPRWRIRTGPPLFPVS